MGRIIRLKAGLTPAPITVCPGKTQWLRFCVNMSDPGHLFWEERSSWNTERGAVESAEVYSISAIVEINLPEIEVPSQ